MNLYYYLLILCCIAACTDTPNTINENQNDLNVKIEFSQFSSIYELLIAAGDFSEGECTLSKQGDHQHIQVSNLVNADHSDALIREQVKRNIVFVAFQGFARTDIEEFTINSIPLSTEVSGGQCHFLEEFRTTISVKRKTAIKILDIYFFSSQFQNLYDYNEGLNKWRPNEKFKFLQHDLLHEVYYKLAQ